MNNLSYWQDLYSRRKGLLLAILVSMAVMFLPSPPPIDFFGQSLSLSLAGQSSLALLAFLVIVFITEALPVGAAFPVIYGWVVLGGIIPAKEAGAMFSSDATWFLVGALMLAQVLLKYDIHKRFLVLILRIVGSRVAWLVMGVAFGSALLSSVISDHAVVSFFLPVIIAIIIASGGLEKTPNLAKCLLFATTYGASLGGLVTPAGGGRNIVMISLIEKSFGTTVHFGPWLIMAMPIMILTVPLLVYWLLYQFKPETDDLALVVGDIKKELDKTPMSVKEWVVTAIYLGVIATFIFGGESGMGMIALLGVLAYLALRLARWEEVQKIEWGVILLYFGAIGFGSALQTSGAAGWLAAVITTKVAPLIEMSTFNVAALAATFMTVFTEFMSDGPAVASTGPVFLEIARLTGTDPIIVGVAMAIASSFAFAMVIGTPANAIAYSSGYLKAKDFFAAGVVFAVICLAVLLLVVKFWWIGVLGVGINGFH